MKSKGQNASLIAGLLAISGILRHFRGAFEPRFPLRAKRSRYGKLARRGEPRVVESGRLGTVGLD